MKRGVGALTAVGLVALALTARRQKVRVDGAGAVCAAVVSHWIVRVPL